MAKKGHTTYMTKLERGLGGALFLLMADNVSRNLLQTEIPLGILTAFVGAPFFLWLIVRKGERA